MGNTLPMYADIITCSEAQTMLYNMSSPSGVPKPNEDDGVDETQALNSRPVVEMTYRPRILSLHGAQNDSKLQHSKRRQSFAAQVETQLRRQHSTYGERLSLAAAVGKQTDEVTAPFESKIAPTEMRQLALVAHNHMKPAMKQFIDTYSEVLKKFRITGTQTTMKMCKSLWGEDDPSIHYGLTCTSGPLGGDAQIAALMCMEDLGCIIFFVDPLSAHPHQADIDSLLRLANCGNIIVCPNPASASSMMHTLRCALMKGDKARGMIPSFFETLESPAVEEYKHQQAVALANVIKGKSPSAAPAPAPQAVEEPPKEVKKVETKRGVGVSFGEDSVFEDAPLEQSGTKAVPGISDSTIQHALMGQTFIDGDERLRSLLAVESDDDDSDEEEDSVEEPPATTTEVSRGLFGIKTSTKKSSKGKARMNIKKLGKGVRKMVIKE